MRLVSQCHNSTDTPRGARKLGHRQHTSPLSISSKQTLFVQSQGCIRQVCRPKELLHCSYKQAAAAYIRAHTLQATVANWQVMIWGGK